MIEPMRKTRVGGRLGGRAVLPASETVNGRLAVAHDADDERRDLRREEEDLTGEADRLVELRLPGARLAAPGISAALARRARTSRRRMGARYSPGSWRLAWPAGRAIGEQPFAFAGKPGTTTGHGGARGPSGRRKRMDASRGV